MKKMFTALFLVMIIGNAFGITKSFHVQYSGNSLNNSVTQSDIAVMFTDDTEAPLIPMGLVASNITDTSFDLSWTASTDNVAVFGYEVFQDGVWIGANTAPTLHITGLTAGTSYNFTVDAFDTATPKANISAPSAPLTVTTSGTIIPPTPDTEAPSIPVGLVASNITETSFDLSWTASTDNVAVFGYEVFQDGVWIGANTAPTLHITGLTAETSYNFTVDAFDTATPKANISAPSAPLSVTTTGIIVPPTPDTEAPSVPAGLVASNITETSFDLSWTASTDNVAVFGYEVFQDGVWIGANTAPTLHIIGLTEETSYNFNVDAFDTATPKANISAPSAPLSVTTTGIIVPPTPDTEAPSVPAGLVASNITETSFDLSWTASTDNVAVFGYEVFQNGVWIGANTVPSLHITGLTSGTSYNFTVDAFDTATPKANISAPSAPLSVTTSGVIVPPTPDTEAPSIPVGLVASNITETSFDLTWEPSTDNVAVFGYEVFQNGVWVGANTAPSLHVTGLLAGTSYNFTIDAFDTATPKANISAPSTALKVTTTGTPVIVEPDTQAPSIPTGLVATNITETSFDLSWNASTDNVAVFGYEVYSTSFVWIGATTTTSLHITGLTKGTTYKYTVDAFDTATPANISKASAVFTVTTSGASGVSEVPTVPTGLLASKVTKTSCTLSWAASTDNIGVHGYQVYKDGLYLAGTTGLSMDIAGLECGSAYAFTVDAFDSETPANISKPSAALLVSTVDCLVSVPDNSSPKLSIFPNPVASVFTVKNLPVNAIVSVLTLDGRTISKANTGANSSMEFDVTSWNSGVYLIQVQTGSSLVVKKVIVEK